MTRLAAIATCGACEWTQTGDHGDVDRAAEKHTTKIRHATAVLAEPQPATSPPNGARP